MTNVETTPTLLELAQRVRAAIEAFADHPDADTDYLRRNYGEFDVISDIADGFCDPSGKPQA